MLDSDLAARIAALESALAYAIKEADGWHDDSRGGQVMSDEMNEARALIGIAPVSPREMTAEETAQFRMARQKFFAPRSGEIKFRRWLPYGSIK